jgi:hypothetical protein
MLWIERRRGRIALALGIVVATLIVRVWGISDHFPLLGDQIRDWDIVLGPFSELPLIGPPTHVRGYTIGPAFYWIMWLIRVSVGPWFDNLPHAGGIGQALLQGGADAVLALAVWHRTRSVWLALAAIVLLATASFDLSLAAVIWNPVVGSILAKLGTALVLLDWPQRSALRGAVTAAVAWSAVHAYTGAIFVALGVLAALILDPVVRRDRAGAWRSAGVIVVVILLLQLPLALHQVSNRFADAAMGAVSGGIRQVILGIELPRFGESATGYGNAFTFIQASPWGGVWPRWLLAVCAVIVTIRYRRDPVLLAAILAPQVLAVLGFAFWLGGLDSYYYLSLMPAAVLTILLGITGVMPSGVTRVAAVALLVGALAVVPARLRFAATLNRMPEYGILVRASRDLVRQQRPIRGIDADFVLPPTASSRFMYGILGGRFDPASPWLAVIAPGGAITYKNVGVQ